MLYYFSKVGENMKIGENIRKIRKEKGLTQKQLGELCGMKEANIRKYELDNANPKIETVERIASALGVKIVDLMGMEYFDTITDLDALKKDIAHFDIIARYFKTLGFSLQDNVTKWHWKDNTQEVQIVDEIEYIISKDGHSATFTQREFDELQTGEKELIEGKFYKKLMQN